jgi:hypothetical protein
MVPIYGLIGTGVGVLMENVADKMLAIEDFSLMYAAMPIIGMLFVSAIVFHR